MKLKILTPAKIVLERDVDSVTLPGEAGQLTVLPGHDRLIAGLKPGRIYFRYLDKEKKPRREDYDAGSGFVEVTKDAASVFVDSVAAVNPSSVL
ncbi:MAG: hypothetical protein V2A66_10625 [Pseudomonadota bacterium]